MSPIETLAEVKSRQLKENNHHLGIDCLRQGTAGMASVTVSRFVVVAVHSSLTDVEPSYGVFVGCGRIGLYGMWFVYVLVCRLP